MLGSPVQNSCVTEIPAPGPPGQEADFLWRGSENENIYSSIKSPDSYGTLLRPGGPGSFRDVKSMGRF